MKTRQEKLIAEILLFLCYLVAGLSGVMADNLGLQRLPGTGLAEQFAIPVVLAMWVTSDARARGQSLCYEFDSFIFLAWPLVVPGYLFRTRGLRGVLPILGFAGIVLMAVACTFVACVILSWFRE